MYTPRKIININISTVEFKILNLFGTLSTGQFMQEVCKFYYSMQNYLKM